MASRKELKKDIDYLVFELIADCYGSIEENPEKDLSGFEQVINDAIELKDQLITRINQFDCKESPNSKAYFKAIKTDLTAGLQGGYEKLESILG